MDEHISGTKVAERLWTSPEGATMAEVIAATGGPKYNYLKQLRARGYRIEAVKEGRETRYFATAPSAKSYEATMTSKGQVTVPREVRDQLRLQSGRVLRFTVEDEGRVVMTPVARRLSDLAGVLPKPKRSATLEDIDDAVREAAIGRYRRAVGGKR